MACRQQWLKKNGGILLWGAGFFVFLIDLLLWADQLNEWSRNHSHLIKMLAAFAPAFIALIALNIAWRQKQIAQNKLKLDLFERRYDLYKEIQKYIHEGINNSRGCTESVSTDVEDMLVRADFLLNNKALSFWLRDLRKKVLDAGHLQIEIAQLCKAQNLTSNGDSALLDKQKKITEKEDEKDKLERELFACLRELPEKLQDHITPIEAA